MWWIAPALLVALAGGPATEDSIEVVVRGTLRTGIMAVGGETTGTTISARGVTWELDLRGSEALRAKAERLAGRRATVRGSLEVRPGVERRQRTIVVVSALEPVPSPAPR